MKQLLLLLIGISLSLISCNKNIGTKAINNTDFVLCSTSNTPIPAVDAFQAVAMKNYERNGPVYQSNNTTAVTYVIYISYDGDVTSGLWTPTTAGTSNYVVDKKNEIEREVEEDYSTFVHTITRDVNVYNATPVARRAKIIVGTGLGGLTGGAPGSSFIGSGIGLVQETPALVMSEYDINQVKIAISHECAHLLGLYHISQWSFNPCVFLNEYDPGVGPPLGAESWTRIMGNGTRSIKTFDYNGPKDWNFVDGNGCPLYQNDWAILNATMAYKTDVDWDTFGIGHTYRTITLNQTVTGTIVGGGDKDIIKLTGVSGVVHIDLSMDVPGHVGNTELSIKVYNGNGIIPSPVAYLVQPLYLSGYTYTLPAGTNYFMVMSNTGAPYLPLANSCGQWALKIY